MKEIDNLKVREEKVKKSHTIIAMNLQTIDDVEHLIRQCEALKGQMTNGLDENFNTGCLGSGLTTDEKAIFIKPDNPEQYKILTAKVIVPISAIGKD